MFSLFFFLIFVFVIGIANNYFRIQHYSGPFAFVIDKPVNANVTVSFGTFPPPRETTDFVVLFVLSRRDSFAIRKTIRKTWGYGNDNVYFVIGKACSVPSKYRDTDEGGNMACKASPVPIEERDYMEQTQKQILLARAEDEHLLQEQTSHRDLLLVDDIDIYRSLSKKLKFAYTFAMQMLPTAKWVIKIDDDFFVRVKELKDFITRNFNDSVPTLISGLISQGKAATRGKWKEVPQYSPGKNYPPFPLGSYGHVVSRPIVEVIVQNQNGLFDYQGEDTSLGIWLNLLNSNQVIFHQTKKMKNDGKCLDRDALVVGHDVTTQKMIECNKTL